MTDAEYYRYIALASPAWFIGMANAERKEADPHRYSCTCGALHCDSDAEAENIADTVCDECGTGIA